ncbi:GNAT family N-acetyltransferase [Actinoplanes sp. LDG1-06]|uniref:GNAT family N-acetyltransferase n=1 Tax=Paractinoplanes ovalisporus TaxID=2810368 RepID=A0ABS2APA8_9ACTN|nr:GNAT family N-acetyltransferase [Actinoplanes ovalisporus]MBM2621682.1 GNAT family N-acetyltransferase [Actinoplanes ovalisporus]
MLIEARPALDPELGALVAAQQREGGQGFAPDDRTAYFVAVVDGRAVGCGAWRPLPPVGVAELNRLYVRPAFRGRGIARQMIVAIEEEALAAGRPVLRLTAGASSPTANALFQSSGYHRVPSADPALARWEKRLAALVQ